MISVFENLSYGACERHARTWLHEHWSYYQTRFCCKQVKGKHSSYAIQQATLAIQQHVLQKEHDLFLQQNASFLCVLPKSHTGRCVSRVHHQIFTNATLRNKLQWIFVTPGNDDYVFRNRCSRLFPIRLTDSDEKVIRDKNIKLKCAIPLKDASIPEFILSCYLDYMVLFLHVRDIEQYINHEHPFYQMLYQPLCLHKDRLSDYFASYQRTLFNDHGFTICPITGCEIKMEDLISSDIDQRNNVQLGHVQPRSCDQYTIRGYNVLLMSREGNRILGDYHFLENDWIRVLQKVISFQTSG